MVGVTLLDILKMPILKDAKVLAGEESLNNYVKGIAVAEVPDIVRLAKKDTIYLSTLFAFKDESSLETLITGLKKKGAAALFVKPKRFYGKVPEALIDVSKRLSFPLVEIEENVMWSDLIRLVLERILEEESKEKAERNLLQAVMENSIQAENEEIWTELLELKNVVSFRTGVLQLEKSTSKQFYSPNEVEKIARLFRNVLSKYFFKVLILPLTTKFVFLVASNDSNFARQKELSSELKDRLPGAVLVLSKHFSSLSAAHKRFSKVLMLSRLIAQSGNSKNVVLEEEKEEDIMLGNLLNNEDVQEMIDIMLQNLKGQMSAESSLKLLWTVYVFLKSDLNQKKASDKLKIHVNTLKYRLNRFEEITGINLSSSAYLYKLYILLKIMDLKGLFKGAKNQ